MSIENIFKWFSCLRNCIGVTILYVFLLGCGAEQDDNDDLLVRLSQIQFADPELQSCIENSGFSYENEVVTLTCANISNLAGMEKLTALESLTLEEPRASNLNLSPASQIKSLYILQGSPSSLDLSALQNLEELHVYGASIIAIDLQENKKLNFLELASTSVATLNLQNNPKLSSLILYENAIRVVDFPATLNLQALNLFEPQMTSIQFPENTQCSVIRNVVEAFPDTASYVQSSCF